jgi:hypothetical protein
MRAALRSSMLGAHQQQLVQPSHLNNTYGVLQLSPQVAIKPPVYTGDGIAKYL